MTIADLYAARAELAKQRPYFATVLYSLRFIEWRKEPTLAVDDKGNLFWHKDIVWNRAELLTVLYHEISHLLRNHAERARRKHAALKFATGTSSPFYPELWNAASDCEINEDLQSEGLKFPTDRPPLLPSQFNLPTLKVAEVYYDLLMTQGALPRESSCGSCAHGQHDKKEQEASGGEGPLINIDDVRRKAAKDILSLPGNSPITRGWIEWAKTYYIDPKIWRSVLSHAIKRSVTFTTGYQDYTYQRPSRREHDEFILPAMRRPLPHIAVCLDISGSMRGEPSRVSLAALDSIFQHVGIAGLSLLCTNTEVVKKVDRLRTLSGVHIPFGGGTSMEAGIAFAKRMRPAPTTLVILTDGETNWPSEKPEEFDVVIGLVCPDIDAAKSISNNYNVPSWANKVNIYFQPR